MGLQFIILVTPLKTYFITNTILFCPDTLIYQTLKTSSNSQSMQDLFLFIPSSFSALCIVGHLASLFVFSIIPLVLLLSQKIPESGCLILRDLWGLYKIKIGTLEESRDKIKTQSCGRLAVLGIHL